MDFSFLNRPNVRHIAIEIKGDASNTSFSLIGLGDRIKSKKVIAVAFGLTGTTAPSGNSVASGGMYLTIQENSGKIIIENLPAALCVNGNTQINYFPIEANDIDLSASKVISASGSISTSDSIVLHFAYLDK